MRRERKRQKGLTQVQPFVLRCFLVSDLRVTMFGERDVPCASLVRSPPKSVVYGRLIDTSKCRFGWWPLRWVTTPTTTRTRLARAPRKRANTSISTMTTHFLWPPLLLTTGRQQFSWKKRTCQNVAVPVLNIKREIINFAHLETMLNSGPPDVSSPFDDFVKSARERISEQTGDQIVDVPVPQIMPEFIVAPCSSTCDPNSWRLDLPPHLTILLLRLNHVTLAPAAFYATTAPVSEYVAPAPADTLAAPATVIPQGSFLEQHVEQIGGSLSSGCGAPDLERR